MSLSHLRPPARRGGERAGQHDRIGEPWNEDYYFASLFSAGR